MTMRLLFGTLIDLGPAGTGQNVTIDDATPCQMQSWWYDEFYRDVFRGEFVVTLDEMFQRCGRTFNTALVLLLFGPKARKWQISDEDVAFVIESLKPVYAEDDWRYSSDLSVILQRKFAEWVESGRMAWPNRPLSPAEYFSYHSVYRAIQNGQCDLLVGRVRFL